MLGAGGDTRENTTSVRLAGRELIADGSGALAWPEQSLLVVADLHLEKGSAYAKRGLMLPPYDTRATLARLAGALKRYRPNVVVALGDSLHDDDGAARMSPEDARQLRELQRRRTWIWVRGNHDPRPAPGLGGEVSDEVRIAGVALRHLPSPEAATPEIAGHLHPAARLDWSGACVRRRCFAADARRVVMPAFGAFTGGLNVLDEAFDSLFGGRPMHVLMLGARGVYAVPSRALTGD